MSEATKDQFQVVVDMMCPKKESKITTGIDAQRSESENCKYERRKSRISLAPGLVVPEGILTLKAVSRWKQKKVDKSAYLKPLQYLLKNNAPIFLSEE